MSGPDTTFDGLPDIRYVLLTLAHLYCEAYGGDAESVKITKNPQPEGSGSEVKAG